MKLSFDDVSQEERGILNRQFDATPFAEQQTQRQPVELAIFDFDSTLFYSPLLSPTLWHPTLVHALTTENFLGPGWWRDIRSLELGDQVEASNWEGFWNPHILQQAQESIKDPKVLTVVLTGRRVHPFNKVVPRMLTAQNLQFDMVCMRPDPEIEHDPSVFNSTMDFKQAFILNMLNKVPSLERVVMWDDRFHHVKRFRTFLDHLRNPSLSRAPHKSQHQHLYNHNKNHYNRHSSVTSSDYRNYRSIIKGFKVNYVHGIRPRYNPEWEKSVVNSILEGSTYSLVPMPSSTVISLSQESVEKVKTLFPYKIHIEKTGELPIYFGNKVVLANKELPRKKVPLGGIGTQVDIKLHSVSCYKSSHGLQLLVTVSKEGLDQYSEEKYPLPLYFKPSERNTVTKLEEWDWSPTKIDLVIKGKVDYGHLQGIETLQKPGKRGRDDQ